MIALLLAACGTAPPPTIGVVVAARDLNVGVEIAEGDIAIVQMRPEFVPPGVFRDPEGVVGRLPASRILANEPIRGERLADAALQQAMAKLVPPGLEVTVLDLADDGGPVPAAGDQVDVVRAHDAEVVVAGLPVFRIDRRRVAVIATPETVQELTEMAKDTDLVVILSQP